MSATTTPRGDTGGGKSRAGLAAVELADGNAQAAVDALAPVLDGSVPVTHVSSRVQAVLLDAIARDRLGDAHSAASDIERALDLAEPDGIVLPFALTGTRDLLERDPRHNTAHARCWRTSSTCCPARRRRGGAAKPAPALDALSDGELRVLRYLPSNLSAPEIGAELDLSLNTIRTHMRHIYAKLGAHSRTQAVERPEALKSNGHMNHAMRAHALNPDTAAMADATPPEHYSNHVTTAHPAHRDTDGDQDQRRQHAADHFPRLQRPPPF